MEDELHVTLDERSSLHHNHLLRINNALINLRNLFRAVFPISTALPLF